MVNSGWLTSYVLKCMGQSIWNQRHVCIEFVINNISPQGNVKIKLNLKVEEIFRDCSANFLWNNWQLTKILFSHIRHGVAGKPPPLIFSKTTFIKRLQFVTIKFFVFFRTTRWQEGRIWVKIDKIYQGLALLLRKMK